MSTLTNQLRMRILPSNLMTESKFTLAERVLIRIGDLTQYKTTGPIFDKFNDAFWDLYDIHQESKPFKQLWQRIVTWTNYLYSKDPCSDC